MTDSQPPLTLEETRREIHCQYFYKLCEIKAEVDQLRYPTLDSDQLQSLCVGVLDDLDVDEASPFDFGPRYFAPLPKSRLPDLIQEGETWMDDWASACTPDRICDPFSEATCRTKWVHSAHGTRLPDSLYEKSEWVVKYADSLSLFSISIQLTKVRSMSGPDELPYYDGYHYRNNPELFQAPPVFKSNFAYGSKDKTLPHMIGDMAESEDAGPEILRSDIVLAITLMKRQFRSLRFTDHHTIPVRPSCHIPLQTAYSSPRS